MGINSKQQIIGSIGGRWPKKKVVRWMEWGAAAAILGIWIPDWSGSYIQWISDPQSLTGRWQTYPPILTYIGAMLLLKACLEGIKDMGWHYKGIQACGYAAIGFALLSSIGHFFIRFNSPVFGPLILLFIGIAVLFSIGFLWITIDKVAEISAETRILKIRNLIQLSGIASAMGLMITILFAFVNHPWFGTMLRTSLVIVSLSFGICRYGVYCYKTQKSIGAIHTEIPDEQFWI